MVLRVPIQPEADMLGHASDLKLMESELIRRDAFGPGASIWKCSTHTPDGIGYWIGNEPGDSFEFLAYLALVPRDLDGFAVLEAKKGWTEPDWRRKGLGKSLLKAAAEAGPLLSDADGMTPMAFRQWESASEFKRRWWDAKRICFVEDSVIPPEERFTAFESGRRWLIVMELN